jgi:hypothetical protein
MKTPLIAVITGIGLGMVFLANSFRISVEAFAAVLFGTSLIAWTIEQYRQHHLH